MDDSHAESALRQAFSLDRTPPIVSPGLAENALAAARKRRRRRRLGALSGAVAATALVVPVIALAPHTGESAWDSASSTPRAGEQAIDAYTWAQRLRDGQPAAAAFVLGRTVHVGGETSPLPPEVHGVLARVGDGWIVTPSPGAGWPGQFAVLHDDGALAPLVDTAGPVESLEVVVSPDGTLATLGSWVVNTVTGQLVSRLPGNFAEAQAWTPAGIVFSDRVGDMWAWRPGTEEQFVADDTNFHDNGYSLEFNASTGCDHVTTMDAGFQTSGFTLCSARLAEVSNSGSRALTWSGDIVGLPDGAVTEAAMLPASWSASRLGAALWEDDTHVVVSVQDTDSESDASATLLVRCDATTGECERASPPLHDPVGYLELFPVA